MNPLYRMPFALPSLVLLTCLVAACDSEPPPKKAAEPVSNVYLEALQEAEAVRHSLEERKLEEKRIDELLGRAQPAAR